MESQVGMLESRKKEIEKQNEEVNKLYYNKLYLHSLVNFSLLVTTTVEK